MVTMLTKEAAHEGAVGELGQNLGRDAAADVDAAGGEEFEREVGGLGAVISGEEIEGLFAERGFFGERGAGDDSGRREFATRKFFGEPRGFFTASGVAEKFINIELAVAGEDMFPDDLAEWFLQMLQQGDVECGARGEVGVATFGGDGDLPCAAPDEAGFAEAGAGGDDGLVAVGDGRAGIQCDEIGVGQPGWR